MILEVDGYITESVPLYYIRVHDPLNPARRASRRLLDIAREHGNPTEVYTYDDMEENGLVVGVRYTGLEKWE